jgi:NAD(P)-dependent dehydrogenase (short-subunit alcohol dehydrogenase family)
VGDRGDAVELTGKAAVVTGGAHRVGHHITLALARRGCDVLIHYHRSEAAAARTRDEAKALGVRADCVMADLRTAEGVGAVFAAADSLLGGLDVLVNSAAELEPQALADVSIEDWERVVSLNLRAPFFCLQQAALRMQARGGGAIVNISDIAGHRPWPRYPVHSISKAGVEMLTKVAALSFAPSIRVNAVAPGPVEKPVTMTDERWAALASSLPLQRPGSGHDVAQAVLFCLENDYLNGETLFVDGGDHLR